MSNDKLNAVELTEIELNDVSGGVAITIGDAQGYAQSAMNEFFQKNTTIAQQTFAGPGGSGTASVTNIGVVGGSAGQTITAG